MSNTLELNRKGFGIELEGFIMGPDAKPLAQINGESSYKVLSRALGSADWLSAELLSCQAEIKTEVHETLKQAVCEIQRLKDLVNFTLARICPGAYFATVATADMSQVELIAADPTAPSFARVLEWSKTNQGQEILRSTATCSMQICVSNQFYGMTQIQKWEWLQNAFSYLHINGESILNLNESNRFVIGEELIQNVKRQNFQNAGLLDKYGLTWITRPCGSDLDKWYMAHSGVLNISEMNSKDGHSIYAKGKMIPGTLDVICIEYRFKDATENIPECAKDIYDVHDDLCISTKLDKKM